MRNATGQISLDEIERVAARLQLAYPYILARKSAEGVLDEPPLASLIRTILSQHTTDINRDRAFTALRDTYPAWEAVATARVDELAAVIRQTNYAYTKAERIIALLQRLQQERGELSLDFLRDWPSERMLHYLTLIPGVGEKSAAIVCLFSLHRPVMAVDTHVFRVTQRLGWIDIHTTPARAHALLQALIPADLIFPLHLGLWEHGRVTCRPQPKCGQCAIYEFCRFAEKSAPQPPVERAIAITAGQLRPAA